ncbi:MAG: hypothetical protein ACFB02_09700 [Mastigocoleus sp.]
MQTPSLTIKPLERLQVNDGLLLTAKLWKQAHDYHRQRQNIYYQSLHQPGIISGLGICIIEPPEEVAAEYKDRRWLKIKPGVAIDVNGNPIVVPRSLTFRIASDSPKSGYIVVYVVINYVDPDKLQIENNNQLVTETFRIDEKTNQPDSTEIELCRILLSAQGVELTESGDILSPQVNNVDLRFRKHGQFKPSEEVIVGYLGNIEVNQVDNVFALCKAVPGLYHKMEASLVLMDDSIKDVNELCCDIIYITYQDFISLRLISLEKLQQFLKTGAVLFIEASAREADITDLSSVKQQLQTTIHGLSHQPDVVQVRQELEVELDAVNLKITEQLEELISPMNNLTSQLGFELSSINCNDLSSDHLLRNHPFLFSQLPVIGGESTYLFNWGGIILSIGNLSSGWGINNKYSLSRETIRSAQEIGINILYFSWYRHQIKSLSSQV